MLKVTLDLRCNVCGGERFMIPTLNDLEQDVRCADCHAFKCCSDALEETMASSRRRLPRQDQWGYLAS
ncbi:hypothetical protein DFO67_1093 [Modicisalibacter xianhensis]|uniref:Uncharacterized protein n=1 Tax=Modicisalibacter xianhensis TaxID=442341 RepID=A0A4V3GTY2_9GAMM|nr:hypothetical protein [Halomonas xianhensis]TDX28624.1 hypothetical protein DFO67_1093 [Halomonas xianhensis]